MERRNRNIWIAVIVIAVVCCFCVAAVAAGALAWSIIQIDREEVNSDLDFESRASKQVDQTFEVGDSAFLEIKNFAGNVTVRAGEDKAIHIVAIKTASSTGALDEISISMNEQSDRVVVRTQKTDKWPSAKVDLEITAPPGTEMDLHTGAGEVELRDMTGTIRVHTGAGDIDARGAAGPMELGTGAGSVRYEGTPTGYCRFETGAGEITLRLPANPDVRVDLHTGLGSVNVSYDVDSQTSARDVEGVIGNGDRATIYASTGLGSISVRP